MMLNNITLSGRLTKDPELKQYQGGAMTQFSIACDRDYKDKQTGTTPTDFFNCVTWNQSADYLTQYGSKVDMVLVKGRLEMNDWVDKEGQKRRNAKINADRVYIVSSKQRAEANTGTTYGDDGGTGQKWAGYGSTYSSQNLQQQGNYGNAGGSYGQGTGSPQQGYGGEQMSYYPKDKAYKMPPT